MVFFRDSVVPTDQDPRKIVGVTKKIMTAAHQLQSTTVVDVVANGMGTFRERDIHSLAM